MSFWITIANHKIAGGHFGQDLDKLYYFHWPDRHELNGDWPQVIKDYFAHNFDFFCVPKSRGPWTVPWVPANITIDQTLIDLALQEINDRKQEIWADKEHSCGKNSDGSVRDRGRDQWHLCRRGKWFYTKEQWPNIFALLESLKIQDISSVTFGFLQPNGFIWLHTDEYGKDPAITGLNDLYVPLIWPDQNLFKFSGSPTIKEPVPILANISDHVHALVNDSNQERVILSIRMDKMKNTWLYGDHLNESQS